MTGAPYTARDGYIRRYRRVLRSVDIYINTAKKLRRLLERDTVTDSKQ